MVALYVHSQAKIRPRLNVSFAYRNGIKYLVLLYFESRLVAEGFTVLGAIIYLVLEIKDVLISQGIKAQLNTLVRISYVRLTATLLLLTFE